MTFNLRIPFPTRPHVAQGQPATYDPNTRVINGIHRNRTIIELNEAIQILISSFPDLRQFWSEHSRNGVDEFTTFFQFYNPDFLTFQKM